MKKLRKFAGILLILIAVLILVVWEAKGREMILMDNVLVAKHEIRAGETLDQSMFAAVSVPRDAKALNAVTAAERESLNGRVTNVTIPQNGQMPAGFIRGKEVAISKDDAFFVIRREWIFMRSSALRRGDYVDIVSSDGEVDFGRYKIAFVKNAEEQEVLESDKAAFDGGQKNARTNGNYKIDHVEIVATKQQYLAIKSYAESGSGPSLILIGRDGQE